MTIKRELLTQQELKKWLHYNPETGVFTWAVSKATKARSGFEAGNKNSAGHIVIHFHGVTYVAQRLAWLYVHGKFPTHKLIHKNGDTTDNRLHNLATATSFEIQAKFGGRRPNYGFRGVSFNRKAGKFVAAITRYGVRKYLGQFDTAEEAGIAYKKAAQEAAAPWARVA